MRHLPHLALLVALVGGCGHRETEAEEELGLAPAPEKVWILDRRRLGLDRIRLEPDGEKVSMGFMQGKEEGAEVVVLLARTRPQKSSGRSWENAVTRIHDEDLAVYVPTGERRQKESGRWREFRRVFGEEAERARDAARRESSNDG